MRNYLLGAAALLAFAAPGLAHAQTTSAYVDASYQSSEVDTPLGDDDGPFQVVVPGENRHARWVRQVTCLRIARDR